MSYTLQEIDSQPEVWQKVIQKFLGGKAALGKSLSRLQFSRMVTTGCGSTYFPESSLAKMADVVLCADDAHEESVVQTRSFTSMYLLSAGLAYVLRMRPGLLAEMSQLPDELEALVAKYGDLAEEWAELGRFKKIIFLGNGPNYGLACEAMLKVKEMSLSCVEAYHTLEFRHVPMSLVDGQTLVVGFVSRALRQQETEVWIDLQKLGGTIVLCDDGQDGEIPWIPSYHIHPKN